MSRLAEPLSERFWRRVDKNSGACWIWTGAMNNTGYGRINVNGRVMLAHRVAWMLAQGALPASQDILHKCDVPACVNPAHLFAGSHADNMADMARKLRTGVRKLTTQDVKEIRRLHKAGFTGSAIARAFGIRQCQISEIYRGNAWRHVASDDLAPSADNVAACQRETSRRDGERCPSAKLTDAQASDIRRRFIPRTRLGPRGNCRDLAREYGVTMEQIRNIASGRQRRPPGAWAAEHDVYLADRMTA